MKAQGAAQSVHGPCQSELVCRGDGEWFHRLPTPWGELWWFDREWNPVDDPFAGGPLCYFIGAAHGPVKIGFSTNPDKRMEGFQLCSPYTLSVLATVPGGIIAEREYHKRFAGFRLHGEWFERCPEIEAEIARLSKTGEA